MHVRNPDREIDHEKSPDKSRAKKTCLLIFTKAKEYRFKKLFAELI